MNYQYNTVQPESLKATYSDFDDIDFLLNFENKRLVLGSVKIEGVLTLANSPTGGSLIDKHTGIHQFFLNWTIETQQQGSVENLNEYARYVKMVSDLNHTENDYFNASFVPELRCNTIQQLQYQQPHNYANTDFCMKPMICLNNALDGNTGAFSKTGSIYVRCRLNPAKNIFYGTKEDGTTYTLSNLKLSYLTMDGDDAVFPSMSSYVLIKQTLVSGLSNVNTKVPAVCNSVSCSLIAQADLTNKNVNKLKCVEPDGGVTEVNFMFNDSTQNMLTYPLQTREEIQDAYFKSMTMTNKNALQLQNTFDSYGLGLAFSSPVDLRVNKFSMSVNATLSQPHQLYMYFGTNVNL